jgi:hypothetical protein
VPPLCDSLGEGASFFAGGRASRSATFIRPNKGRAARKASLAAADVLTAERKWRSSNIVLESPRSLSIGRACSVALDPGSELPLFAGP